MKHNNYIWLCISLTFIALSWSVTATVVCVKQDRKVQNLKEQVTEYKDKYHGCLQEKMRLRDPGAISSSIEAAYRKQRAISWQELAEKHNLKIPTPSYVK